MKAKFEEAIKNLPENTEYINYHIDDDQFDNMIEKFDAARSAYNLYKFNNNPTKNDEEALNNLQKAGKGLTEDLERYIMKWIDKTTIPNLENASCHLLICRYYKQGQNSVNIYMVSKGEIIRQLENIPLPVNEKTQNKGKESLNSNSNQQSTTSPNIAGPRSKGNHNNSGASFSSSSSYHSTNEQSSESEDDEENADKITPRTFRLSNEALDQLFKNLNSHLKKGEDRNQLTQELYTILSSSIPSDDQFTKLVKDDPNSNLERYMVCNDQGQGAIIIDFESYSGKYTQIKIPNIPENNSFSGVMTIARLDNEGKELDVYDILRIDGGKIIDIFHADPKPTVQNSRIADIYNEFSREPGKAHSFREGIRATSNNQGQVPIR